MSGIHRKAVIEVDTKTFLSPFSADFAFVVHGREGAGLILDRVGKLALEKWFDWLRSVLEAKAVSRDYE